MYYAMLFILPEVYHQKNSKFSAREAGFFAES
jgi:hypothetical protein